MHLSFITGNVLEKFNNKFYNVIYIPQNNIFDHAIMANDSHKYFIFGDNKTNYGISNLINLPHKYISLYNYNLAMTNNIVAYSTNNLTKNLHLNSIIFTHSNKPSYIKKEDVLLMSQKISRESKVFFTETARDSWRMTNNTSVVKYGIPEIFQKILPSKDRKDVGIINFEKLPYSKQIQQALIKNDMSCDLIDSSFCSTPTLFNTFNNYKVIIDLTEHGIINLLCSIACGSIGISIKPELLDPSYAEIPGLVFVNSIDQILGAVKQHKDTPDDQTSNNSNQVLESFDFNTFKNKMNSLLKKANMEVFIP